MSDESRSGGLNKNSVQVCLDRHTRSNACQPPSRKLTWSSSSQSSRSSWWWSLCRFIRATARVTATLLSLRKVFPWEKIQQRFMIIIIIMEKSSFIMQSCLLWWIKNICDRRPSYHRTWYWQNPCTCLLVGLQLVSPPTGVCERSCIVGKRWFCLREPDFPEYFPSGSGVFSECCWSMFPNH